MEPQPEEPDERVPVPAGLAQLSASLESLVEFFRLDTVETNEVERLAERVREARDEEIEGISQYATEPVAKELAKTHAEVAAKVLAVAA